MRTDLTPHFFGIRQLLNVFEDRQHQRGDLPAYSRVVIEGEQAAGVVEFGLSVLQAVKPLRRNGVRRRPSAWAGNSSCYAQVPCVLLQRSLPPAPRRSFGHDLPSFLPVAGSLQAQVL
jgi:hypothetical protein